MVVVNSKFIVKFNNINIDTIKNTLSLDNILVCIQYTNDKEIIHECKSNVHKYIIKKGVDKNLSSNSLSIELKYGMFNMICMFDENKCIINWCSCTYQNENELVDYLLKYIELDVEYKIVKIYPTTEMYNLPNNFHIRKFVKYLSEKCYKYTFDGVIVKFCNTEIDHKLIYFKYKDKNTFSLRKQNVEKILCDFLGYDIEFVPNICIEI